MTSVQFAIEGTMRRWYADSPFHDGAWDKRCQSCVYGNAHTFIEHDVMLNRSIKPECKADVIMFRRRLLGR